MRSGGGFASLGLLRHDRSTQWTADLPCCEVQERLELNLPGACFADFAEAYLRQQLAT